MTPSGTMRAISASEITFNYQSVLLKNLRDTIEAAVKDGLIRRLSGADIDALITKFRTVTYDHITNVMLVTADQFKPKPPAP